MTHDFFFFFFFFAIPFVARDTPPIVPLSADFESFVNFLGKGSERTSEEKGGMEHSLWKRARLKSLYMFAYFLTRGVSGDGSIERG